MWEMVRNTGNKVFKWKTLYTVPKYLDVTMFFS